MNIEIQQIFNIVVNNVIYHVWLAKDLLIMIVMLVMEKTILNIFRINVWRYANRNFLGIKKMDNAHIVIRAV